MRGLRYDRILAGTALALVLAMPATAFAQTTAASDSAVPMPDATALPPPTASDLSNDDIAGIPAKPVSAAKPAAPTSEGSVDAVAPAAAPPPDPYASLDPADRPIAEKIRDLLAAKTDRIFNNRKDRAAAETFYQARNQAPLWIEKGVQTARAKSAIARIKASDADGLDSTDYKLPEFTSTDPAALAEAELRLTATVLTFARHLQAGRFPYLVVSKNIEMPQQPPEQADVLTKVAGATNMAKVLDEYSPKHPQYLALKAKLAELRGTTKEEEQPVRIPEGAMLRPGMEDARVPLLRKRLKVAGDDSSQRYEGALVDAVKAFQKGAGLKADGMIGATTVKQLNGVTPPRRNEQIDLIIVNMERWRWLPRDLGNVNVMVNVPDYMLRVYKDNAVHWQTRVVVGKPGTHATPILHAQMKYITVNPTWNVPPSIVQNEYLPALQQDPTVLARMGLKVTTNRDGSIHIYQPPGDGNALGRVRFNFPNKFLVYQHDTPDKYLFAHDARAYSHGCMRVQDPPKYAEVLLNLVRPNEGWTADRIRKMYGSAEVDLQFPKFIPVNLTYQTAFVDESGHLQTRRDIYALDGRTLAAIKNERGVVEMAAQQPARTTTGSTTPRRNARVAEQPQRSVGFFEALFGGGNNRPTPPNRVR